MGAGVFFPAGFFGGDLVWGLWTEEFT